MIGQAGPRAATAPLLAQAIDRFVSAARQAIASRAETPFRHHVIGSLEDLQKAVDDAPHRNRALPGSGGPVAPKGESFVLMVGGVRITHFAGDTPFELETELDSRHLSVRYLIQGESAYSIGSTPIATARAGDYILRINKSPLIRISTSENYRALLFSIPIPLERRFSIVVGQHADRHIREYLENGFIVTGQPRLWTVHLAYALDYAVETAAATAGASITNEILGQYLYLLCCQDLAARAQSRDTSQQYSVVPLKLKVAENFVIEHIMRAPSVEDVAAAADLSVRNLHALFVKFRGMSPGAFIREQRLVGVRTALLGANDGTTVSDIATTWNYHNFGNFAAAYRKRFGELPSETLDRRSSES